MEVSVSYMTQSFTETRPLVISSIYLLVSW